MMKVEELYEEQIRSLPTADRLRLATMILNDIPPQSVVDYRDNWSDEDLRDSRTAGLKHIDAALDRTGSA
jgi:hypothetical protein